MSFTDQKQRIATEADCTMRWGGGKPGKFGRGWRGTDAAECRSYRNGRAQRIRDLEHALAAEQGRAAALEWLRREQYQRWSSAHDDLCLMESLLVLAVERATKAEQDCDILEAASAHWQAECAKAERERDEARCMWAHDHGFGVEDERAYAAGMWGATEAERLFPEGK